ncbi:OLC1v1017273C2 [Oldenlandia corymbosa var. corymbosa]|uniref:OLC1v1017273C2 n=1 Tax=Oldenlandia corymbosa var. corymbosa TaxID=529605 RepID=A0AAV1E992_OLDCO|nr:OLC1v1017273C2 [Oldenlandia corymbosa var. corymbosa]
MESLCFHDGNISNLINSRTLGFNHDINHSVQMHSSLVRRLSLDRELEGHRGCVNSIAWNAEGSLLISGSDDTNINIWSYASGKLLHSIETGHSTNIFCTKFVPETSDELVVSGAGDAEVRLFNLSRLKGRGLEENAIDPSATFQCHTRRVKKLAVEVGNPNVVWSASEDGTLRQHDFREGASCPPARSSHQECRNILLDLRCGAKKSLSDPPKQCLALKSCDLSPTRPHLLLVGGSDSFARLYDRRMLPPMSSSQKKLPPPPCVSYFCPMHLSDRGRSSLHLTHVTFSPNSEEVLLSYSGEHVYLMDVNPANGGSMRYTSGDVSNLTSFIPNLNGVELQPAVRRLYPNGSVVKRRTAAMLDKCRKLIQFAGKSLKEETNYYHGIEACNEVLDGYGHKIGPALMHECLCLRAALLLKRKWKNDVHMAIRDCLRARKINSNSLRALLGMAEALSQLGKHKEALDFAVAAQSLAPSDPEVVEKLNDIKGLMAAAEAEKVNKNVNGESNSESRSARLLSLSDILYRSEGNSDASQDGPRSDRDDSDYDEELELDFEMSRPEEEGHEVDSNVLHGSLNLRLHRRPDSSEETEKVNGFSESATSSTHQCDKFQPEAVIDMKRRYVGHCNIGTDIKQASFLGQKGEYIASGSDDGRWFVWEKRTGRLVKMLLGDDAVVNCIQCHPFDSVVATSGIDDTIKIWAPTAPVPSIVSGGSAGPETLDMVEAMENNLRRLNRNREAILPFEILERFRMHEFSEGSLHPFECTQS